MEISGIRSDVGFGFLREETYRKSISRDFGEIFAQPIRLRSLFDILLHVNGKRNNGSDIASAVLKICQVWKI
jgi:hypothetical protein